MYFRNEENSQQEQLELQQYADIQCPFADNCPYQQANSDANFRQYNPLQAAVLNYLLPYHTYYPPYFNPYHHQYYPQYHHPYYPPYHHPYYHQHYEPHYHHDYDYDYDHDHDYGHGPGRDE